MLLLNGPKSQKTIKGGERVTILEDFAVLKNHYVVKILMYLLKLFGNVEPAEKFQNYDFFRIL